MALHVRILRGEGGADVVSATLWPLGFSKELSSRRCAFFGRHPPGALGNGDWHAALTNSARSARAGDLRLGRRPALVVDFLARFPEARGDPLGDLLRLFGPQYLPHSGNVLGLGKASLLLPVVLQIAPTEFPAKPRPELLDGVQVRTSGRYLP